MTCLIQNENLFRGGGLTFCFVFIWIGSINNLVNNCMSLVVWLRCESVICISFALEMVVMAKCNFLKRHESYEEHVVSKSGSIINYRDFVLCSTKKSILPSSNRSLIKNGMYRWVALFSIRVPLPWINRTSKRKLIMITECSKQGLYVIYHRNMEIIL